MSVFPCLKLEGGLLAADLIDQIAAGDAKGQKPADFGLKPGIHLTDEISAVWASAQDHWRGFQRGLERLDQADPATSITRDQWMIPLLGLLGYDNLAYQPRAAEVDGHSFAISHRAGPDEKAPPIHIVGCRQGLGERPASGRPRLAAHSLLQDYLNRSEDLWGVVTNGKALRILRDSQLISRLAYIEFDLEQMLEGQKFADFALLYRLLHRSRLPKTSDDAPKYLLEEYRRITVEQGGRVREHLRDGVEVALRTLANGFLRHPRNQELRAAVAAGQLTPTDFYTQLLRLIYRFLFLMVAEERGLITDNATYHGHYSIARLRRLLDVRTAWSGYDDLWLSLQITLRLFEDEKFGSALGIPPLNGDLFNPLRTRDLNTVFLTNRDFLTALWHLAMYRESPRTPWRRINYAALDVEELGSVYESLLDFQPLFGGVAQPPSAVSSVGGASLPRVPSSSPDPEPRTPNTQHGSSPVPDTQHRTPNTVSSGPITFDLGQGTERKSTGSYYTPPQLVQELIKSALVPVMEDRLEQARRLANGQWRTEEEKQHAHSVVSGSRCLAAGHGDRQAGVPTDEALSPGGAVRRDLASPSGGQLDPGQHGGGVGAALPGRVHPVPEEGQWQPDRTGDPSAPLRGSGPVHPGASRATADRDRDPRQAAPQPRAKPGTSDREMTALWASTPLATRHSLLAQHAILSIKVCDPASGSGHFLLAAARRLGDELARIRSGGDEPSPEQRREAVRDIITHCIYAVDKNPLAVDLCKVALWIEGHTRGRPLTFLDHRVRHGDSLVGVLDMSVLSQGIPDDAYNPVTGDDKIVAKSLKQQNRDERKGQKFVSMPPAQELRSLTEDLRPIFDLPDDSPANVRRKAEVYQRAHGHGTAYERDANACDLWTTAFFTPLTDQALKGHVIPTTSDLRGFLERGVADPRLLGAAGAIAHRHAFFHWPLEYPDVFAVGGFDVVLSNPPWDVREAEDQEFFATREPVLARLPGDKRKRAIEKLAVSDPLLYREWVESRRSMESEARFLRGSGRFPFISGKVNLYGVFAQLASCIINGPGRCGAVCPTGIATDDYNKKFFAYLMDSSRLVSLFDFENREALFPGVHRSYKFSLLTLAGKRGSTAQKAEFLFYATQVDHLGDKRRRFSLTAADLLRINPNSRTCPVFRTRPDAELARLIYERGAVLINDQAGTSPWGVKYQQGLFNMTTDSGLFRTSDELGVAECLPVGNRFVKGERVWLPLYEGKMVQGYDHRAASIVVNQANVSRQAQPEPTSLEEHLDPCFAAIPRYWVSAEEVHGRTGDWGRDWLLGVKDVTAVTNERTAIYAVLPATGVGHTFALLLPTGSPDACVTCCFLGELNGLVSDYVTRQKVGGIHLTLSVLSQLAVLPPGGYSPTHSIPRMLPRVLELTYTAWDIKGFADDVWREADEGLRAAIRGQWEANRAATGGHEWAPPDWAEIAKDGIPLPPFKWDEARRALLRAELDALYARLYGLNRKQLRYILDPADLTPRELEDILDPFEEVTDPLDAEGYRRRCETSDFPGETFRVLKEKELRRFNEYRTRRLVLEAWERMQSK